jgi:integrase
MGYDSAGKRKTLYRTFRGKRRDAQAALDALRHEVRAGTVASAGDHTFADGVRAYIASRQADAQEFGRDRAPIDRDSVDQYRFLAETYLLARIGARKLREVRDYELREMLDAIRKHGRVRNPAKPLALETMKRIKSVLTSVFKYAHERRWVDHDVTTGLKLAKRRGRPVYRILSVDEAAALIAAARGTRLHLVIFIAAVSAMRRGEILALTWDAVDLEAGLLHVRKSLRRDSTFKLPKTDRGIRNLAIPPEVADLLRAHKRQQYEIRETVPQMADLDLVFSNPDGRPWNPNSIGTLYNRICRDSRIGRVKLHELRHSLASLLIAANVDVPTVAEILGHADEAFTMHQYVHPVHRRHPAQIELVRQIAERATK